MRYLVIIIVFFFSFQVNAGDNKFTYKGEPIHPLVVGQFETGFHSDSKRNSFYSDNKIDLSLKELPGAIGKFDANGKDGERYPLGEVYKMDDTYLFWYYHDINTVSYVWKGQLSNGYHIVYSCANFGGSSSVCGFKILKFEKENNKDFIVLIEDINKSIKNEITISGNQLTIGDELFTYE